MNCFRPLASKRLLATFSRVSKPNPSIESTSPSFEQLFAMGVPTRPSVHTLPCVLMRAGTSKGLFIHRKDLPEQQEDWGAHLISALGSRGCDPRQIDGVGGGSSTTSKVAIVAPSTQPGVDVDFTFAQVAVGKEAADFSGNCGNIVSGVGPFAVQEGLVRPALGASACQVRIYNTNTDRVVVETVKVDQDGQVREDGEYSIPGVRGSGSEVKVAFVDPAGSMTGTLFPTGERCEVLAIPSGKHHGTFAVLVTLIDAANPFVLIDAASIDALLQSCSPAEQHDVVESVRVAGAVRMGLAPNAAAASRTRGTPKAVLLRTPMADCREGADIRALAYSMGKPHPSLPLTGAVGIAAALRSAGTVAERLSRRLVLEAGEPMTPMRTPSPTAAIETGPRKGETPSEVLIQHSTGTIRVEIVMLEGENGEERVASCAVSSTARRLFEGRVWYYM